MKMTHSKKKPTGKEKHMQTCADSLNELIRVGYITTNEKGQLRFNPILDADYQILSKEVK